MNSFRIFVVVAGIAFSSSTPAALDPTASVVLLRQSCNDGAGGTLNNCFIQSSAMLDWVWNVRNPSSTAPLMVEIGPGTYGPLSCPANKGFVTFRGAGRGRTIFSATASPLAVGGTFQACNQLAFEHLTISGRFIGVVWANKGSSSWTDVEMLGSYSAWYDSVDQTSGSPCPGREGTHKFFGSTLKVTTQPGAIGGGKVFVNSCGKNWLWGSELVLDATTPNNDTQFPGISSGGVGNEVHLYGSNLRLVSGNGSALQSMTAISVSDGAQVHVHGTGIDVIATTAVNVIALAAESGGTIHASESAFVLETGAGGTKTRIKNGGGHVHSPYLWPGHDTPPDITSQDGADVAVVTSVGKTPSFVIYSTACASKWYNVGANACRP